MSAGFIYAFTYESERITPPFALTNGDPASEIGPPREREGRAATAAGSGAGQEAGQVGLAACRRALL